MNALDYDLFNRLLSYNPDSGEFHWKVDRARTNNGCGFLGVTEKKYAFLAQIYANGQKIHLGSFRTAEAAHQAYLIAKRQLHPGNTL